MSLASLQAVRREMLRVILTDESPREFSAWCRREAGKGRSSREIAEEAFKSLQRQFKVEFKRKRKLPKCLMDTIEDIRTASARPV
jgi:hypothetical protein